MMFMTKMCFTAADDDDEFTDGDDDKFAEDDDDDFMTELQVE